MNNALLYTCTLHRAKDGGGGADDKKTAFSIRRLIGGKRGVFGAANRSALPTTLHELPGNERSNTPVSARPEESVNLQSKRVSARSRGASKGGAGGGAASWSKSDVKQVTHVLADGCMCNAITSIYT